MLDTAFEIYVHTLFTVWYKLQSVVWTEQRLVAQKQPVLKINSNRFLNF